MVGILSGNPKDEPLHYGEIYGVWQYAMTAKLGVSFLQAYLNHAGDKTLREILHDMLEQTKEEVKECDTIITANGFAAAPDLPERPEAKLEDIPLGARLSDQEIAAAIAVDNAAGLVICSQMMGMTIREDIGALFAKYHTMKAANGLRILRMNKEKGWLIPPPLQTQRPELVEA